MAIGSASIVYIIAESGTGKTFSGDYLDVVHGFKHVDGDMPLKNLHLPRFREAGRALLEAFIRAKHGQDFPTERKLPYYEECARLTLEAAEENDKVVFSHATPSQSARDHFVEKLVEGGVPRENVRVVQLWIEPDVKYRGLYYRTLNAVEASGVSIEDNCRAWGWEFEGKMTADKFVECSHKFDSYFKGNAKEFEDCPAAKKVDVSGRDISHCDNLDEQLGLVRKRDWTYEEICNKVKPIDAQRDREAYGNSAFSEAIAEIEEAVTRKLKPDEPRVEIKPAETEQVEKRRTSIIQADVINGRHLSCSITEDEEVQRRRSTLIFKGKLDLNLEQ